MLFIAKDSTDAIVILHSIMQNISRTKCKQIHIYIFTNILLKIYEFLVKCAFTNLYLSTAIFYSEIQIF